MKISLFILAFFIENFCFANEIDNLKTPEDVLQFVKKTFNKNDEFRSIKNSSKSLDFKYIKIDIDNNGLTDIIINGIYLYAILDKGENNFVENYIGGSHFNFDLLLIDSSRKIPLLIVQKEKGYDRNIDKDILFNADTLINKFGGFIEYNPNPIPIIFKKIKIMTSPCYGTCPIFDLSIDNKKNATLNAKAYNKLTGYFESTIDEQNLTQLVELLSYLNIDSLKTNYEIGWTDNPSIDLEIRYNGIIKKIHDYGLEGSLGLKRLYEILFVIKSKQDWE